MWFKKKWKGEKKVKKVKILLKFLINLYTCFQGCLGQFWFRLWSSYMCILLKPAMEKLGNARALDPASLLGGLMSYHCLLDQWGKLVNSWTSFINAKKWPWDRVCNRLILHPPPSNFFGAENCKLKLGKAWVRFYLFLLWQELRKSLCLWDS